jgi:hypothetical protein
LIAVIFTCIVYLGAAAAGTITRRNVIDCFPPGLRTPKGKIVYCETSAVAYIRGELILANDKPIPGDGRSPVFIMRYTNGGVVSGSRRYLVHNRFTTARKFEGITTTPDDKTVIATTAFDRIKLHSSKWDGYNTLLSWPADKAEDVSIISSSSRSGVASSRSLRDSFRKVLRSKHFPDGPAYFKIEGLAAIPGNKLLFGFREIGESYRKFVYSIKIVSVSYELKGGAPILNDDFKLLYHFDPPRLGPGGAEVGLSSLEYDRFHNRLYLLTSFEMNENDEGLGGYLWTLRLADLVAGRPPSLVDKKDGRPLRFAHKAEGIAVIDKTHLFVVHDDDRVVGREKIDDPESHFHRLPNQAAYSIVALE